MGGPAAGGGRRRRDRWRVRRLAGARVVSTGGSQAAQIALVYQIYAVTHSGSWVAASLFASLSVGGLLGPVSGWIADRYDRRLVMVASELGAGSAYLAMAFAHAPALLVTGALAATVLGAPFRAASAAAIPNLVDIEDLGWANGLLGTASNAALVAGPFVGGALVAVSGAGLVFAVNTATFVVSAAVISLTPGSFGTAHHGEAGEARALLAGFRRLITDRVLAPLTAASSLAWASFGSAVVIDPVLTRAFHAGSVGYGLLTAVWGGGAVVGAVIAGRTVRPDRAPDAVVWGMAAMAVSLGSVAVLPTFPLIVAAGTIGGAGSGFVFVPWILLVQHHTVDALRGRVIAAADAFNQVAFLVGMGLAVPAVALVGAHHSYALAGILLAIASGTALRARITVTAPSPAPLAREEG